jgi:hypothetical protein
MLEQDAVSYSKQWLYSANCSTSRYRATGSGLNVAPERIFQGATFFSSGHCVEETILPLPQPLALDIVERQTVVGWFVVRLLVNW